MDFNNKESIRQFALEDFQNRFSDTYEQNKRQINGKNPFFICFSNQIKIHNYYLKERSIRQTD